MKKFISWLLIMILALGTIQLGYAAGETNEGTNNSEKLLVLKGLGFIPQEYKEDDTAISRAEAVSYIMDIVGIGIGGENDAFSDVPAEYEYYAQIAEAYNSKYINGVGDGKFEPEEGIKPAHLKKIVVDVLGYKTHAHYLGYDSVESDLKIFRNIDVDENGSVTKKGYVKVLYNMLHSKYAEAVSVSGKDITFETVSNKIFLNKFDIYRDKGILEAVNYHSLNGNFAQNGYVKIDGETIKCSKNFDNVMPGSHIEYYFSDDNENDKEIIYLHEFENTVYTLKTEDITSFTSSQLEYCEADDTKQIKKNIDATAAVLLNYAPMSPFEPKKIMDMDGTVYLIDNDSDENIDCILVEAADVYFVSMIDEKDKIIYDKRGKKPLDLNDYDIIEVYKNNKRAEFSEIQEMTVLNIYCAGENVLKKSAKIEISTAKFAGEVQSINSDGEYSVYDKTYKLVGEYDENRLKGYKYSPDINVGTRAMFYLDASGKIAAADTDGYDGYTYGLVLSGAVGENLSDAAQLKIYTQNDELKVYDCKDKVKYNGKNYDASGFIGKFEADFNINPKTKLIKFSLDSNEKVAEIFNCASNNDGKQIKLSHEYLTATYWVEAGVLSNKSDTNNGNRTTQYGFKSNTTAFQVPASFGSSFRERFEEKDFSIIAKTGMVRDDMNYMGTEIYDADDANGAGVMIIKTATVENYTPHSEFMFVNKVTDVLRDGETTKELQVLWKGEETKIYGEDEKILKDVEAGDIIQPILNANSEVKYLKIVFRFADSQPTGSDSYMADMDNDGIKETPITQYSGKHNNILVGKENSNNQYSNTCVTVFGNMLNKNESGFTATYTDSAEDKIPFYTIPKNIIVCENLRNGYKYRTGSWDEIRESDVGTANGSEVFLNTRNQKVMQLVLFK